MFYINRTEQLQILYWTGTKWSASQGNAKLFETEAEARAEMKSAGIVYKYRVSKNRRQKNKHFLLVLVCLQLMPFTGLVESKNWADKHLLCNTTKGGGVWKLKHRLIRLDQI